LLACLLACLLAFRLELPQQFLQEHTSKSKGNNVADACALSKTMLNSNQNEKEKVVHQHLNAATTRQSVKFSNSRKY